MHHSILVVYATKHGSTREVAEAIAGTLRGDGYEVAVSAAADVTDLGDADGVVLGGALYTGRWHRDATRFLRRFRGDLAGRRLAIFAMGPKTSSTEDLASSRDQLDRALRSYPDLRPASTAVFGGVIDPAGLRFPFSHLPASDARDWRQIRRWASEVGAAFATERTTV